MSQGGFEFFYNYLELPDSNLKFYYDFSQGSGSDIPVIAGDSQFSGTLSSVGDFYVDGGGFFNGQTVEVNNSNEIDYSEWTLLLDWEKTTKSNCTIFSCLSDGSGYLLGINDANKLYVATQDEDQNIAIKTFKTNLSSKNLCSVSKYKESFSLSIYQPRSLSVVSEEVNFPFFENFENNSGFRIGNEPNLPVNFYADAFEGNISKLAFIDNNLGSEIEEILLSGWVREPYELNQNFSEEINNLNFFNLSGEGDPYCAVSEILTFIETQIFANSNFESANLTGSGIIENNVEEFNGNLTSESPVEINQDVYEYRPSTSCESSYKITANYYKVEDQETYDYQLEINVPTIQEDTIYGHMNKINNLSESYVESELNLNYLDSLNKDGVSSLLGSGDYVLANFDQLLGAKNNKKAYADNISNLYYAEEVENNENIVWYRNGTNLIEGDQWSSDELGTIFPIDDLEYSENSLYDEYKYSKEVYSFNSGDVVNGYSSIPFLANSLYFLNGSLLERGRDYFVSPFNSSSIEFITNSYANESGQICVLTPELPISQYSNQGFYEIEKKIITENSQLFLNGSRLNIGSEYIETSKIDLVHGGVRKVPQSLNLIYSSDAL